MLFKLQKKLLGINYAIDTVDYDINVLTVKGWIFSVKHPIKNVKCILKTEEREYAIPITYGIKRNDVFQAIRNSNAKKSGFLGRIIIENVGNFEVYIEFNINNKKHRIKLDNIEPKANLQQGTPRIEKINIDEYGTNILELIKKNEKSAWNFPEDFCEKAVDIIIPVYNGYQYLEKLFETVELTSVKKRLIIINDKSPDERVLPYLKQYASKNDNVILVENEENLGFVQSVNKGLDLSENHVVLLNTDVELPENWLERLIYPILMDEQVATVTPYTNCGTLCSFPNIAEDNDLFEGCDLEMIDQEFRCILPRYTAMPTGVGFCMAMNKNALEKIGKLDAESFGKGYGEENDWCQRAIEAGYKNVQAENLFVYHKHGGSFLSEDKKRYLEENGKILLEKHPNYNKDVARFMTLDPNRDIRDLLTLKMIEKNNVETIFAFSHDLGGGAADYLIGKRKQCVDEGKAFCVVRFDVEQEFYKFSYFYKTYKIKFCVKNMIDLFVMMDRLAINEIWINELVSYTNLYQLMDKIRRFAAENKIGIRMLLHDYFAVCPTVNLLNADGQYCGIPKCEICGKCLERSKTVQTNEYENIEKWRTEWGKLLTACKDIIVFSCDSKKILEKTYGKLENIVLCPHETKFMPTVEKEYKTTKTLNVGLLGVLTKHKGKNIIKELLKEIEKQHLDIRIVLIGAADEKIKSPAYKETGRYTKDSIPRLVLENDIDVFLIPSIWPETFSYTTDEIMKMGLPVMCFDIGAPAERVKKYNKGIIIKELTAEAVLDAIKKEEIIHNCMRLKHRNDRVLFVVEEITFSSRYRVDHLREQLIQKGIPSDCVMVDEVLARDLTKYNSVVVYRSSQENQIEKLVKKAHRNNKKVYYDIDDYIFDYENIKNLQFLNGKDYVGFEKYSESIKKTMELCDGYIVSTENLRQAIQEKFADKPVWVNRNVASMEMLTISLWKQHQHKENKVLLGYFSGSKTHDDDFKRIKDDLLYVMQNNENVYLMVGGQIELPPEFNMFHERIERFDFVSWKKLPELIAQVDINLMPLEDTFFHACKSENKWMEAALVNVPTIATWNNELARAIEHGKNGYVCKDTNEWKEVLQLMIHNKELRENIAKEAHKKVLDSYTTFQMEEDVLQALVD